MDTLAADTLSEERRAALAAALAETPDGVVEVVAAKAGVPPLAVLEALPGGARLVAPDLFEDIWADLTGWGEVLLIVHTEDIVLEAEGTLPPGTSGHGWFNIHGDSPIGGHIRRDRCRRIAFVDRLFHGRRSCSVWFVNGDGHAMFKVFVRRDESRALIADQLARFEALRERLLPAS